LLLLGISAFYHDSAAALLEDGVLVAAAQEERFTRKKHDEVFPANAISYCLGHSGRALGDVDHVVFYEKPFLKFDRLLETYLAFAPRGFSSFRLAMPLWMREKLRQRQRLVKELRRLEPVDIGDRLLFAEHHQSHAASAFYPSPFDEAAVLTMDGVGEWATTTLGHGRGTRLELIKEIAFPHSLGLLYSAFTYYTGFKVNSGEYKLMGLAPYGEPRYAPLILEHLMDLKSDGSFHLDLSYFDYCTGLRMTNGAFDELFGGPPRNFDGPLEKRHLDLAASIQAVTDEVVLRLARSAARVTGSRNLCLAGGVALNCVANGKVLRDGPFDEIWVQPAAGDAGGAIGAAFTAYYELQPDIERTVERPDGMRGSFLGPSHEQDEIARRLRACSASFEVLPDHELLSRTAAALADSQAVGWFQGRMEFGPRALGARSILADARSAKMQSALNLKVKFRESFRPFAPAVLREDVAEWFNLDTDSPYMLIVADVAEARRRELSPAEAELEGLDMLQVERSEIPAVTHVDCSARIQTVDRETNPRFHALLSEFKRRTGCAVIVNTSFNVRGEPIVCTPEEAFECFMATDLDVLVAGNCYLEKTAQDPSLATARSFEPD